MPCTVPRIGRLRARPGPQRPGEEGVEAGIGAERDLRQLPLAEIRHRVPRLGIDQREDGLAGRDHLALGDFQPDHAAGERCPHLGIAKGTARLGHSDLTRADQGGGAIGGIDCLLRGAFLHPRLAQRGLGITLRGLSLIDLLLRDEALAAERAQPAGGAAGEVEVGLRAAGLLGGDRRGRTLGGDNALLRRERGAGNIELCLGGLYSELVGHGVEPEQQLAFGNAGILGDRQFDNAAADQGRHVHHLGIECGILGGRALFGAGQSEPGDIGGGEDHREGDKPAEHAVPPAAGRPHRSNP
jgi:hypothetical protein